MSWKAIFSFIVTKARFTLVKNSPTKQPKTSSFCHQWEGYNRHAESNDSSYPFVSTPKVVQLISMLRGTTGSYGGVVLVMMTARSVRKSYLSQTKWQLLKRFLCS